MNLGLFSPVKNHSSCAAPVTRIHKDIDMLFDQAVRGFFSPAETYGMNGMFSPHIDLHTDDKKYTVDVEVPGIDPKQITLSLQNSHLTISGEKVCCCPADEKKGYTHRERLYGTFGRTFELPDDADTENITASCKNGVLTISIPRKTPAECTCRQINISCADA